MVTYVTRNGSRLTPYMFYQIERLNTDFKKIFGVEIIVTSGIRLHQEQIDIFLKRYVKASNVRGRKVYDTRVWKGVRYYRISSAGTVAAPGSSNHEIQGTRAAVDLRDTGKDAGVAVAGSRRSNWLKANASKYGLVASGFGFREPWHYDVLNIFNAVPGASTGGNQDTKNRQTWLNRSRNEKLKVDGIEGSATKAAYKRYQTFLKSNYDYTGAIDGIWGKSTQASHQKYYNEFNKPAPAPNKAPAFPLKSSEYFGPEAGGTNSISGWYSHSADLRKWQQKMKDRGWGITADGLYGPKGAKVPTGNTADITKDFQKEKGLKVDGLIGPATWKAAWESPVTPANPTTPTPKPETPKPSTPLPSDEVAATPNLVTPGKEHFPPWIRFEVEPDPEGQIANLNTKYAEYYGVPYDPIESHWHWWGTPGKAGTHDSNVSYIKRTDKLSVNFVLSENRITLMVPINKIALTTGRRNPYAWKVENDPALTEAQYKTMGYLLYIVEKLNPSLANDPVRLHKEFSATSCSEIDPNKVRKYAEDFRTGRLDPATGNPPVPTNPTPIPNPEPSDEFVLVSKEFLIGLSKEFRKLADDIEGLTK